MRFWIALLLGSWLVGCAPAQVRTPSPPVPPVASVASASPSATVTPAALETLNYDVIQRYPHEKSAFTQGLLCDRPGHLWESTGQYGHSRLAEIDLASGKVVVHHELGEREFGEGLAFWGGTFFWLTWQNGFCHTYNEKLKPGKVLYYEGEGWGLCPDGQGHLWMSNGSADLVCRDPKTFKEIRGVTVKAGAAPIEQLNELEWVDGKIYANIWGSSRVVVVDPKTGEALSYIDFSGLLSEDEARGTDVLNGIAYWAPTRQLWVTGKYWPKLFEVKVR